MKRCLVLLFALALAGCALRVPAPPSPAPLLHDHLFPAPAAKVDAAAALALDDAMRRFAADELQPSLRQPDPRRALVEALHTRGKLRLEYDASVTRTAAESFDARAGNCLSLVLMTAAIAKHLGLPVGYRSVLVDDIYARQGGLQLASGHVNLVLDRMSSRWPSSPNDSDALVVDFLPQAELSGQRSLPLAESTIVAMYLNNRAAETLAEGRLADSYAWARAAVLQDPGFAAAINTLAVVYLRGGHLRESEAALRSLLAREPAHVSALSNLVQVLRRSGRDDEAQAVQARLTQLQPHPPFHFFDLGRQAMAAGDAQRARAMFARELDLQPDQHEVLFWAAQAEFRLGNAAVAARLLRRAMDTSPTPGMHRTYAAKLDRLRAARVQ